MSTYQVYFHDFLEISPILKGDSETGELCIMINSCENERFFDNKNLRFRIMERHEREFYIECWLEYVASNDHEAIRIADSVLQNDGFDYVDVYCIVQHGQQLVFDHTQTYADK
ncbi:MAG: hypothetical protein FMNOHCHN_03827 [Ignavibacteriaceae bacterium]|nr:hypothetical protein [Ignavibacteriaceae bacterium]